MYRKVELPPTSPESFEFPSQGKLSPDNRWVIMANLIPWSEFEEEYAQNFSEEMGAPAKAFRMALGALIITEKLGTSVRDTFEQIKQNPYLPNILKLSTYSNEATFEASMLVHFRAKIGVNLINKVNKKMVSNPGELTGFQRGEKKPEKEEKGEEKSEPKNQEKLSD